jgi:hypothetical protein
VHGLMTAGTSTERNVQLPPRSQRATANRSAGSMSDGSPLPSSGGSFAETSGCCRVWHTIVVAVVITAIGTILQIHHFVGVSLLSKEFGLVSVRDAEVNFFLSTHLAAAVCHFVAGVLIVTKSCHACGCAADTKPVFFGGLFLGILGLVFQWVGESIAMLAIADVLLGAMMGLCGTALLLLMQYRYGSRFKATATGTYFAMMQGLGELLGGLFGVVEVERNSQCYLVAALQYSNTTQAATSPGISPEDCLKLHHFQAEVDVAKNSYCVCEKFRPSGPIGVAVLLGLMLVGGFLYPDKSFMSKAAGTPATRSKLHAASSGTASNSRGGETRYALNRIDAIKYSTESLPWYSIVRFICCTGACVVPK